MYLLIILVGEDGLHFVIECGSKGEVYSRADDIRKLHSCKVRMTIYRIAGKEEV